MGKLFSQLTEKDRIIIETMMNNKYSQAEIARYLGVHRSTISREVKRGMYKKQIAWHLPDVDRYSSDLGQLVHDYNQTAKGKELKIGNDYELVQYLEEKIGDEKYSPEAALAEIKNQGLEFSVSISVRTLYRYIDRGLFLNISNKDLPSKRNKKRKMKHVHKQKRASVGTSIEKRPLEVLKRNTFGHWEMDTVKGKQGTTKSCLLVLSERKTRMELIRKLKDQTSLSVVRELDAIESEYGPLFHEIFKSITVDNGVEFSNCYGLEHSPDGTKRTNLYYCHAYCSCERGTNENINRMIRRHIPKGNDFDSKDIEDIKNIEKWINNYPRKIFGFAKSIDLFNREIYNIEETA